jgi:hypothetical protein
METKKDIHQEIMDKVYDLWKSHGEWSQEDLFDHITYKEKIAVALGNFNYQVENGGFMQWRCNGYMARHYGLLSRLKIDANLYPELNKAISLIKEYRTNKGKTPIEHKNEKFAFNYYDNTYYNLKNRTEEMNNFIQSLD